MTRGRLPIPRPRFVNTSRVHLAREMRAFAAETWPGMRVLDAGAGRSPYRHLFNHAEYEAADFAQLSTAYAPLDLVCDLTDIPVEDERYDRTVFNQVLEHVPTPRAVLAELYRVLKPGGILLCTCPLYFPEHQKPYDFFRYTQFALRLLFEEAGFRVRRLAWLEGYFGTVAFQFREMHRLLPPRAASLADDWRRLPLQVLLSLTRAQGRLMAAAWSQADLRWHFEGQAMPKNYLVIAEKPREAEPS